MQHNYDDDVAELIRSCDDDTNPINLIWAIFDHRCANGTNDVLAGAFADLAPSTEQLDEIPLHLLEILARLLPADATNSTFDDLLDDVHTLMELI